MAFDNRLCKFVFKWFIFAFKIFCYFDKVNECYFTMIYEDCDTHRQSSFCFYKINPSSGNLKRINNGYKPNSQGYGKSKMAAWLFPAPWTTLLLFDRMKPFLGVGLIISQWKKKMVKIHFLQSPVIRAPTLLDRLYRHWQKFHELLRDCHVHWRPLSSGKDHKTKGLVTWDWTAKYDYNFHDFLSDILLASNLCFQILKKKPSSPRVTDGLK